MIVGSERKVPAAKRIRAVALQSSTMAVWLKDQLAPPKVLTKEERRARVKKDTELHRPISDLWED